MKKFAVLVAGGQGSRMGHELPKQFLPLNGKPVLLHTLEKFSGIADEIVIVLPSAHITYWKEICSTFEPVIPHKIAAGGPTRTASVLNGLGQLEGDGIVAIHDAVRPLASRTLINNAFKAALIHGSAVPVIPVRETLRMKKEGSTIPVDREQYMAVQTPQCFIMSKLRQAYAVVNDGVFSDDATVYGDVHLIEGESANIKITYREDLVFAAAHTV